MSMLNLWFCGRIRSPLQLNSMQKTQSATTVSHFFVFRFPERLNQGYKLVNRVFSSEDDQRLGDLICAGSGISHLTNCGTDFLTVRESMPIWDTGTSFPKVSHVCRVILSSGFKVCCCSIHRTEFSSVLKNNIFLFARSVLALHLYAFKSLRILFNSFLRLLTSSTTHGKSSPRIFSSSNRRVLRIARRDSSLL